MSPDGVRRVVAVQLSAGTDKAANIATVDRLVAGMDYAEEFGYGPDLVVLPEATMHDFGSPGQPIGPVAEPLDGPFVRALARIAADRATAVVAGMFETAAGSDRAYNTLVALDYEGNLVGSYRKVHLYDAFSFRESDTLVGGDAEPPVLRDLLPGLSVGLLTCYDLRFPELARSLVDRGADVLLVPAAWVRGPLKEMHWATLLRARAIENTAYVVAAAQCGPKYCGNTMVLDPHGVTVGALGEQEGVLAADLRRDRIREVRRANPSLTNRRYPTPRLG